MDKVEYALAEAIGAKDVVVIIIDPDNDVRVVSTMSYAPDIAWTLRLAEDQLLDMHLDLDS